jgi:hypothetical protein
MASVMNTTYDYFVAVSKAAQRQILQVEPKNRYST